MLTSFRHSVPAAFALAAIILVVTSTAMLAGELSSDVPRVRPVGRAVRDALEKGMARSATLRDLIDRLQSSDVIVHVAPLAHPDFRVAGELQFAAATPEARYLRIGVRLDPRVGVTAATIAHELQHAIEIASNPRVVDTASMDRWYRAIGYITSGTRHETDAARIVASRVLREVTGAVVSPELRQQVEPGKGR